MKKPPARGATLAAPLDVLDDRGREALRQGRFKEAMEVFKQLARQDPRPEWTQRLGDAYVGRAHALADKGMFKEAAMVLENTLSPDGTIREPVLYLTWLIRQGQHQKAAQTALRLVKRLPAADAGRVAELAAALALAVPARTEMPGGASPGGDPNHAARAALAAWLQGKPSDEVDHLLARIPLRSPFGPLRLILKSLITPADAAGKARSLLAMVPAGSMFSAARAAAEATLADDPADPARALERPAAGAAGLRGRNPRPAAARDRAAEPDHRGRAARPGGAVHPAESSRGCHCRRTNSAPPASICCRRSRSIFQQFNRRFEPLSVLEQNRVLALGAELRDDWRRAQKLLGWRGRGPVAAADARCAARTGSGAAPPGGSGTETPGDARRSMDGPGHGLSRAQPRGRSRSPACDTCPARAISDS